MTGLQEVTCGIKTFLRNDKLAKCLAAICDKGFHEVIVADDGRISPERDAIYTHFAAILPLKRMQLPFDSGVSVGRNAIVKACQTEFLLLLDDDQMIPENISDLLNILQKDKRLGGISGYLDEYGIPRCGASNIYSCSGYVVRDIRTKSKAQKVGNHLYYVYDFIPTSTLFRAQSLKDVTWDPVYKIGSEHIDFFYTQKKLGKWKFAVTPQVVIIHDNLTTETQYRDSFRKNEERLAASATYFNEKWKVKGVFVNRTHVPYPGVKSLRQTLLSTLMRLGIAPPHGKTIASVLLTVIHPIARVMGYRL